ncbi:MAG TPA: BrnT family toxin [Gammaproteobacteria bacterium]|nr:BrnT family toxin [Gammaproteobacteria bacterium]
MILAECFGFEWDEWNQDKNWLKHNVLYWECEQAFFNSPILIYQDIEHSQSEMRYYLLGQTDASRKLFIVFTIRNELIRVISSRDMSKKERDIYEKA